MRLVRRRAGQRSGSTRVLRTLRRSLSPYAILVVMAVVYFNNMFILYSHYWLRYVNISLGPSMVSHQPLLTLYIYVNFQGSFMLYIKFFSLIVARQYVGFLLRGLGFDSAGVNFKNGQCWWNSSFENICVWP